MMCNEIWCMLKAYQLVISYQLVTGRNERWISNVWLIWSPVRMVGYFKCLPAFLGKTQRAAWYQQQLALNSWQLLHLLLRRVPTLHQGLVSHLNLAQSLPRKMTLMFWEETWSKGTHVRCGEKEMLPVWFKWLLRNSCGTVTCGFSGVWGAVHARAQAQGPVPAASRRSLSPWPVPSLGTGAQWGGLLSTPSFLPSTSLQR